MRKVRESSVEKYLVRRCEDRGWRCLKFDPKFCRGMPDRMIVLPGGRVAWAELKTDGGELSASQKYRMAWLRNQGHDVHVVWNKEQVDILMAELERPQRDRA